MSADRVEEAERAEGVGGKAATMTPTTTAATATAVRYYSVAPGVRLNVRRGPGTGYAVVRILPEGARIPIFCQTPGTTWPVRTARRTSGTTSTTASSSRTPM